MAKLNILYIGANPTWLQYFSEHESLFAVETVENGLAAINFLKQNKNLNAILSDLYLPGMNGLEIFKLFRSQQIQQRTPFIILSDGAAPKLKEEAFQLRTGDFYEELPPPNDLAFRIITLNTYFEYESGQQTSAQVKKEYKLPIEKRIFDIVVSLTALLLISPLLLIVMLAIRLESKGKVYYTSKRVGTGYKIFDFYKLRSMRVGADAALQSLKHLNQYDAEASASPKEEIATCPRCAQLPEGEMCSQPLFAEGAKICEYWYYEQKKKKGSATFIKIKDDPRVTKVGKFIRNTSIDELPQLLNVLKGDMSIVGNRPLPLYEAEMLTSDDWSERFLGPAGITGLWQVEKRGKKGSMSEEERKALDNQYARTYSFWGDIKLILRTIPALFQKENV